MSDYLTATIASTLAMSYGSHTHAPKGGRDWKAAEDLGPVVAAELRKARSDALREAAEDIDVSTYYRTPYKAEQHEIAAAYRAALLDRADQNEEDGGEA